MQTPGTPDPDGTAELTVRAVPGLARIARADWDRCATSPETLSGGDETHNPFVSYAFLSALEDSGCVSRRIALRLREASAPRKSSKVA